ncbi:MAG: RNase P modulator RnpM [Anaerovoracaceae bacterium]|jgi:predicted RNA-binding protein YlxR (DUF448 family)
MKARKVPMRKCVGCMESKPKRELIRLVAGDEGVKIDPTGKSNGRGVYLCPDKNCFEKAIKRKAIGRSLETSISEEQQNRLYEELLEYEEKN